MPDWDISFKECKKNMLRTYTKAEIYLVPFAQFLTLSGLVFSFFYLKVSQYMATSNSRNGFSTSLMSRNARSRENGEFDKIFPRLLAKAANMVNLAKLATQ